MPMQLLQYQHSAQHMLDSIVVKGVGSGGSVVVVVVVVVVVGLAIFRVIISKQSSHLRLHTLSKRTSPLTSTKQSSHVLHTASRHVLRDSKHGPSFSNGLTDIAEGRAMTVWLMCSIWYSRVSMQGWVVVYPVD